MVRLVFRRYTQIRRSICTSESLRASTSVSAGFALFRHSSPSFGSRQVRSNSNLSKSRIGRSMMPLRQRSRSLSSLQPWLHSLSLSPTSFDRSETCAHVRLLGPCFKTGRIEPPSGQRPQHVVSGCPIVWTAAPGRTGKAVRPATLNRLNDKDSSPPREGRYVLRQNSVYVKPFARKPYRSWETYRACSFLTPRKPTLTFANRKCTAPSNASVQGSSRKIEAEHAARLERLNPARRIANSIRFPSSGFTHFLTLFSKFFSSFPHGTCSLSVSCQYLALDGVYHPFWAAIPNNPTLGKCFVCRATDVT